MSTEVKVEYTKEGFEAPKDYMVVDRPKIGGIRYYLIKQKADGDDVFHLFPGVTSVLSHIFGKPEELVKFIARYPGGYDAAMRYSLERADYGSVMHGMVSELTKKPFEDQDQFENMFRFLLARYERGDMYDEWIDKAKKDTASWLQWFKDYNVEPVFSEMPLCSFEYGIAGQADYLCYIDEKPYAIKAEDRFLKGAETLQKYFPDKTLASTEGRVHRNLVGLFTHLHDMGVRNPEKQKSRLVEIAGEEVVPFLKKAYLEAKEKIGERKRLLIMPDWKFGNSIAYESYDRQLGIYSQVLLRSNYPDLQMDGLYNWRPTDWKKNPGYEFKEKTPSEKYISHIMGLLAEKPMSDRYVTAWAGGFVPGEVPTRERLPALEFFKQRYLESIGD